MSEETYASPQTRAGPAIPTSGEVEARPTQVQPRSFVKLYGSILDSTIWLESLPTKVVWITMLAMADADGCVAASVPGLTRRAGVTRPECETALRVLVAPDTDSKTPDYEGRRIEEIEGGWVILNHRKYREMRTPKQVSDAARQALHRANGDDNDL